MNEDIKDRIRRVYADQRSPLEDRYRTILESPSFKDLEAFILSSVDESSEFKALREVRDTLSKLGD